LTYPDTSQGKVECNGSKKILLRSTCILYHNYKKIPQVITDTNQKFINTPNPQPVSSILYHVITYLNRQTGLNPEYAPTPRNSNPYLVSLL